MAVGLFSLARSGKVFDLDPPDVVPVSEDGRDTAGKAISPPVVRCSLAVVNIVFVGNPKMPGVGNPKVESGAGVVGQRSASVILVHQIIFPFQVAGPVSENKISA